MNIENNKRKLSDSFNNTQLVKKPKISEEFPGCKFFNCKTKVVADKLINREIVVSKPKNSESVIKTSFDDVRLIDVNKSIFQYYIVKVSPGFLNFPDTYHQEYQRLVKLRQVNKNFKSQVDSFIFECINNDYLYNKPNRANDYNNFLPFSTLSHCDFNFSERALMLYYHAIKYPENKVCEIYAEGFQQLLDIDIAQLLKINFAINDAKLYVSEDDLDDRDDLDDIECLAIWDSTVLSEAYFISQFLRRYIITAEFDVFGKKEWDKLINLLEVLNPYQSYTGMGGILNGLLSKIEYNLSNYIHSHSDIKRFEMYLYFFVKLVEKGILTSENGHRQLVKLGIACLKDCRKHNSRWGSMPCARVFYTTYISRSSNS